MQAPPTSSSALPVVPSKEFHLWKLVCQELDPEDILNFRHVCRLFHRVADTALVWQRLYDDRWGQNEVVQRALLRLGGVVLPEATNTSAEIDWKQKYAKRVSDERQADWSARIEAMEATTLAKATELITKFESAAEGEESREDLANAARILGELLLVLPFHSGAYGLLARAAAACGARGSARELLQLTVELAEDDPDTTTEELKLLKATLDRLEAQHGLIRGRSQPTGAFTRVLTELFATFDADHDGAWVPGDFDRFVLKTNGKPCPPAFRRSVFETFAPNTRGRLLCADFVVFFTHNALEDPQETWNDLAKHGYTYPLKTKTKSTDTEEDDDEEDEDEEEDQAVEDEEEDEEEEEEEEEADESDDTATGIPSEKPTV